MIFHDMVTYFFLVLHNIPLARCIPVYLFTYWIHFGKLRLWQALAIMNKAATNIYMQVLYEHSQTIFKMWIYVCDYIHKLLLTLLHNKSPWKVEAKTTTHLTHDSLDKQSWLDSSGWFFFLNCPPSLSAVRATWHCWSVLYSLTTLWLWLGQGGWLCSKLCSLSSQQVSI